MNDLFNPSLKVILINLYKHPRADSLNLCGLHMRTLSAPLG